MLKLTKKWSLFIMIAVLFSAAMFSSCGDDKKEVQTQDQTAPAPENPSKRPGSVSMYKDSLVLIIGNEFFIATEIVENQKDFKPTEPAYFACGEDPGDGGNGWLCSSYDSKERPRYILQKRSDGYYLPFVPDHEGNTAQFSGLKTGDPLKDINFGRLHLYKDAPWVHIDVSTDRVAIDPLKVIRIPARNKAS